MKKKCKDCKAWHELENEEKYREGLCRRRSPYPAIPIEGIQLTKGIDEASWPITSSEDWCLDFVAAAQAGAGAQGI